MSMIVVSASEHRRLIIEVLRGVGICDAEADEQAELLHEADLRGLPSHGIQRLPVIVRRIQNGVAVGGAPITLSWATPNVLVVDGARGLGPVVVNRALQAASTRAASTGVTVALVSNSNHIGMLGHYAERMAQAGSILLAMTTSEALVHPHGGREALIGTNPIAIGIPTASDPFILDMSTAATSMGRVLEYEARSQPLPSGWAIDAEGVATTDPSAARAGAISPFGGPKGYALALAIEILVGALTTAALGDDITGTLDDHTICNKGDVFVCVDCNTVGVEDYRRKITRYLDAVRGARPIGPTPVRVPGDRARWERRQRLEHGIPIAASVWEAVTELRAVVTR
jgi:L-2-hydroxycarboxylate dehydrogenase (NAD+)